MQWGNLAGVVEHALHAGQCFTVAAVGNQHLPGHGRLDAGFEFFVAGGQAAGARSLLDQRITDHPHQNRSGRQQGFAPRQVHRAQTGPQPHGNRGMGQEGQDHPPGKILRHVFAGFRDVRLEHDEDDAL
ncbi:hypothetical protein D3C78_1321720 [compost metagenome]